MSQLIASNTGGRSPSNWEDLLSQWSGRILGDPAQLARVPLVAIDLETARIGYPPASKEQLEQAQARLGIHLPPSYISFLTTTNGWPAAGPWVDRLLDVDGIDWFAEKSSKWLKDWRQGVCYVGGLPPVDDKDYQVYGDKQNPLLIRDDYLEATLQISDGDIAVYLLNPKVQFENGEWEAWVFESETGARRFRSFWELMLAEYTSYLELRNI